MRHNNATYSNIRTLQICVYSNKLAASIFLWSHFTDVQLFTWLDIVLNVFLVYCCTECKIKTRKMFLSSQQLCLYASNANRFEQHNCLAKWLAFWVPSQSFCRTWPTPFRILETHSHSFRIPTWPLQTRHNSICCGIEECVSRTRKMCTSGIRKYARPIKGSRE
jgi:hypothetical protein